MYHVNILPLKIITKTDNTSCITIIIIMMIIIIIIIIIINKCLCFSQDKAYISYCYIFLTHGREVK